ncbi:MAG: hypothetical protein KC713_05750, partial [Candidatus Omnitrophica bacterium]|nr:hypothetical protein [Candidatus Omnitrophota bacterium]
MNKFYKNLRFNLSVFFFMVMTALALPLNSAWANNLVISNFAVYDTNTSSNTITFQFDIAWDNSWRNVTNYDSVWVFSKFSKDAGQTWSHVSMSANGTNPMGFNAPTNFEIIVPPDEKGFFLQRTDLASGSASAEGVRFSWDYGQDGLTDDEALAANTINSIFGVEMVYIPEGAF